MEGDNKDLTLGSQDVTSESKIVPLGRQDVSGSKDVSSVIENVALIIKDVMPKSEEVMLESKFITLESKNVTSVSRNVTFSSNSVTSESKNIADECKNGTPESKNATPPESKLVNLESKGMPSRNKEITPGNKNVTSEGKKLKSVCKDLKTERKDVLSLENKDLISENKKVTFENKEVTTETKTLFYQIQKLNKSGRKDNALESKGVNSINEDVKLENKDVTGSVKLLRWSIRRDSLPLVSIRNALLKRRNLSPDNLLWRRRSTGNFAAGSAGGGRDVPRSAPATPLQLEPTTPRTTKHEKQIIKPLSGSALSVRAAGPTNGTGDTTEGKQPSKSRQKKFQRHFPQVGPEEKVLNYYSCALVGDLLLQGHLYITKNYFAFYSNVFGYVTKLLIPTTSVLRITKEKVARIIPNAVGVCTRDERHVFGSLLSRDSTYKLMTHVWKAARAPELVTPNKTPELRASEPELDASEYSPEDDSSSAGDRLEAPEPPAIRREPDTLIGSAGASAVIQPALLAGSAAVKPRSTHYHALLISIAVLLALSACSLCYKLYLTRQHHIQDDVSKLSGEELYSELVRFRTRLHGRAANELHTFLTSNLLLLSKVRQSLEALSGVILTDMAHEAPDSVFS